MPSDAIQCKPLEVAVGDKGIERAIKHLKRKLASEGILRELKSRRHYLKPSVKRRKKQAEAARRRRKRAKADTEPRGMILSSTRLTVERTRVPSGALDAFCAFAFASAIRSRPAIGCSLVAPCINLAPLARSW